MMVVSLHNCFLVTGNVSQSLANVKGAAFVAEVKINSSPLIRLHESCNVSDTTTQGQLALSDAVILGIVISYL